VTADPNTNSIIVIAPPDVQRLYEQLIRTLDKRRPQVLIECTIVTIDTTGNFSSASRSAARADLREISRLLSAPSGSAHPTRQRAGSRSFPALDSTAR